MKASIPMAALLVAAGLLPATVNAQPADQMCCMRMESKDNGQVAQKGGCCRRMNHAERTEGKGPPEAFSFQKAPDKKALTFRGKVEAVDERASTLKANGEKVEGWMDAMTMDYKVDNPGVLKEVKPGDQITATVYQGDMTLHNVRVTKKADGGSKSKE